MRQEEEPACKDQGQKHYPWPQFKEASLESSYAGDLKAVKSGDESC